MERAVDDSDANIHDRIAGDNTALQRLLDTLFDARDKLLRNRSANDLVDKFKALTGLQRLDFQLAVAILAGTACLALKGNAGRRLAMDAFAIGHLGRAEVGLHPIGSLQDIDFNI